MPRSHITVDELRTVAVEINRRLGTPLNPWDGSKTAPGCYCIESLNDYVSLVQMTDENGGTRVVIEPTHRGALLKGMRTFVSGIEAKELASGAADRLLQRIENSMRARDVSSPLTLAETYAVADEIGAYFRNRKRPSQ